MDENQHNSAATGRVLLVDDDEQVLFVLSAGLRLTKPACEVVTAQDGWAAYELLRSSSFGLLISDIRLPGIDGVTLTDLVRSRAPQLPVIWMTAYGCRSLRREADRLHIFRCLEKPVELDEFRQVVRQAMSRGEDASQAARPMSSTNH